MRASYLISVLSFGVLALSATPAFAEPWDEVQDTKQALLDPDTYAWRLFVSLNWPADVVNKLPDKNKKFGDPGPVVWETWRNARNQAADTVFKPDGSDPGPWLNNASTIVRDVNSVDTLPLQQIARQAMQDPTILFDPISAVGDNNETRLNKATYEFVRANELYNLDGQKRLSDASVPSIQFPAEAKEIKARWREISEADKPRYHWTDFKGEDGITRIYGLSALHITTKDLPNWLWATFEHIDNKIPEAQGGRTGNEGWLLKSRDRAACPDAPYDCEAIPSGFQLEGTVWENYRLRGVQTDFVDSRGNPTRLANSKPEEGFQETSSCITCHALATIGTSGPNARANRLTFFDSQQHGPIGAPDAKRFEDDGNGKPYTQLDFVWSLSRARPKSPQQ